MYWVGDIPRKYARLFLVKIPKTCCRIKLIIVYYSNFIIHIHRKIMFYAQRPQWTKIYSSITFWHVMHIFTPITQKPHHNTPRRACPVLKVHLTLLPRILCVRTPFAPIIIIITRTCHFTHHTLRALHTHHLSAAVHTHRVQFVSITILVQSNIYEYTWYTQKVGRQEMDCANAISWLEILYNVGRGAFGNAFCLVISCVC